VRPEVELRSRDEWLLFVFRRLGRLIIGANSVHHQHSQRAGFVVVENYCLGAYDKTIMRGSCRCQCDEWKNKVGRFCWRARNSWWMKEQSKMVGLFGFRRWKVEVDSERAKKEGHCGYLDSGFNYYYGIFGFKFSYGPNDVQGREFTLSGIAGESKSWYQRKQKATALRLRRSHG
jgi:hypothetical protein